MAGVKKCADNNGGQSEKRSHEATQRWVHSRTQEVEERSRWRRSLRHFSVHRNQGKLIPSQGPDDSAGPLLQGMASAATNAPAWVMSALMRCGTDQLNLGYLRHRTLLHVVEGLTAASIDRRRG